MKNLIFTLKRPFYYFVFIAFLIGCNNPDKSGSTNQMVITPVTFIDSDGNVREIRMDTLLLKVNDNNKKPFKKGGNKTYADNIIVIRGTKCGDNQDIVDVVYDGKEEKWCQCKPGYEGIIVEDADGDEVLKCISNEGVPPGPDTPPGLGDNNTPTPPTPISNRPTLTECADNLEECKKNVRDTYDNFLNEAFGQFVENLMQLEPCHNRTPGSILGERVTFTEPLTGHQLPCLEEHLLDINSPFHQECMLGFVSNGVSQCMYGVPGTKSGATSSSTITGHGKVKVKVFEVGAGASITKSQDISFFYSESMGANAIAQSQMLASIKVCSDTLVSCENLAKGTSNLVVKHVVTPEELINKINKAKLGFGGGKNPGSTISSQHNPFALTGPFKDLKKHSLESQEMYMSRLKFLVNYSNFLETSNLSEDQINKVNSAFRVIQSGYNAIIDYYISTLTAIYLNEIKNVGNIDGIDISDLPKANSYSKSIMLEKIFTNSVNEFLKEENSTLFFETVWPGINNFSIIQPMNKPGKLAPTDPAPTGPKDPGHMTPTGPTAPFSPSI